MGLILCLGGSFQADLDALSNQRQRRMIEEVEKLTAEWEVRHQEVLAAGGLAISRY